MNMNRFTNPILTTRAALILLLATVLTTFAACSSDDAATGQQVPATDAPKTYTMTVTASKGDDATTRALSIDDKTLNATWAAGEHVAVYALYVSSAGNDTYKPKTDKYKVRGGIEFTTDN